MFHTVLNKRIHDLLFWILDKIKLLIIKYLQKIFLNICLHQVYKLKFTIAVGIIFKYSLKTKDLTSERCKVLAVPGAGVEPACQ